MKNLRKIIALFACIFILGTVIIVNSVNSSLNKPEPEQKTVEIQKDTTYLLKAEKKTKTV